MWIFRINIISGGDHLPSSSKTKTESIRRGVYICDVRLPNSPFLLNDTIDLEINEGWIEKSWCSGYFFWTTLPDNGYMIRLKSRTFNPKNCALINHIDDISLGFFDGDFYCRLNFTPKSDTITFNLYKKYLIHNPDFNIIGNLKLILNSKAIPNN